MSIPPLNCRLGLFSSLITVFLICFSAVSGLAQIVGYTPQSIRWETDLNVAMARAEQENRPLFLHFVGHDCPPAKQMENEVFNQPNIVANLVANFVMVKINAQEHVGLAQRFAVTAIPTDLIIKPNGQALHRRTGGITADKFSKYLVFLQETIQSERNQNPAIPLAASAFPVTNPVGSVSPPALPPGTTVSPLGSLVLPPGVIPQNTVPPVHEASPPNAVRDPFMQQMPQPPPAATGATLSNPLRTAESTPKPMAEHNVPNHNVLNSAGVLARDAAPPIVSSTAISAMLAEEPAPAKMTVEVPLALEGFCPVALCTEERWVSGNPAYCTMYQGHIFRFATPEALGMFVRNPANYIPVAMGEDVVLMVDRNKRVNGNRKFGAWFQERVFLFSSQETLDAFAARPEYYTEIALKYELARREQSSPSVY